MAASLDDLEGRLLIQCRPAQAVAAAGIASAHGAGLVVTGARAQSTVEHLRRRRDFTGPLLCDADRYSGRRRLSGGRGITPGWFRRQRDLGLVPLSDSGYLAARNWVGLRTILRGTAREPRPSIALLPLAARWFATPSICAALAREISTAGVPVAVVIEHGGDPFAVRYVLRGFLRLLRGVTVPLMLLRSDISALGALCHGALASAVGTSSALRHLYPVRPPGSIPRPAGIATFVTPLLSYHAVDTVKNIVDRTPEHAHLWRCTCPTCDGRPPLIDSAEPAFRHALHAQLALRSELFRARTREALISTWHEHCSHALSLHEEIARSLPGHRPPGGLRRWLDSTDDPMSEHRAIPGQPRGSRTPRPPRTGADAGRRDSTPRGSSRRTP